jgi:flagellar biosynthetic protein FliR
MMELAQDVLGLTRGALWHGFFVFLRVGGVIAVMPAFGQRLVPMRVRLALALGFTGLVAAVVEPFAGPVSGGFAGLFPYLLTEPIIGLLLGIGLRLFVLAMQTAGSIAAQSTSLAQILGGAAEEPMPAIGQLLVVAALALAMLAGLHVRATEFMILSYGLFPPGLFPLPSSVAEWGVTRVAQAFALAFRLAVPFVIISVLYNLTLGVVNRAMPQLMVAFVGAPLITFGGLALLLLLAPLMLSIWVQVLGEFLRNPVGAMP